jgi:hypothetical protein
MDEDLGTAGDALQVEIFRSQWGKLDIAFRRRRPTR